MPKTGIEVFDAEVVYAGGIDPYAGDNGIRMHRVFETPLHTYRIVREGNPYADVQAATALVDGKHEITLEVEGIASMICEERMGHASRLDDVLAKQAK